MENKNYNFFIMNRIQKKRLYESIMKNVSKTVKHKLNEDIINSGSELEDVVNNLSQKIKRQEDNAFKDRLPEDLYYLLYDGIGFMGDGPEYLIIDNDSCPYDNVDEIDSLYINFNYNLDGQYGKRYFKAFLRNELPKCMKKMQGMITNLDCTWKGDDRMLFIHYKGELNTIDDLKTGIISLSKILFQIESYFAELFT